MLGWCFNVPMMHQLAEGYSLFHPLTKAVDVFFAKYTINMTRLQVESVMVHPEAEVMRNGQPLVIAFTAMIRAREGWIIMFSLNDEGGDLWDWIPWLYLMPLCIKNNTHLPTITDKYMYMRERGEFI